MRSEEWAILDSDETYEIEVNGETNLNSVISFLENEKTRCQTENLVAVAG